MRIAVTGGNGKLGRAVVRGLRDAAHEVFVLDSIGERGPQFTRIDLTNYGSVVDALHSINDRYSALDALVHLAAIPAGGIETDSATFHTNLTATFNAGLGLAIVKAVVDAHGGFVSARSRKGSTTFRVELPETAA